MSEWLPACILLPPIYPKGLEGTTQGISVLLGLETNSCRDTSLNSWILLCLNSKRNKS